MALLCNPNNRRRRRPPGGDDIAPRGQPSRGATGMETWRTPFSRKFTPCASLCLLSILRRAHANSVPPRHHPAPRTGRALQSGLIIGQPVDLDACYAHLRAADVNGDGMLSPPEFLDFVQLAADGQLDANEYGIPITEFSMLPQEFIGIYNFFACGNANYGCPSVAGIDVAGLGEGMEGEEMTAQQEGFVFQLCKFTDGEVESLPEPGATGSPVAGSVVSPTGKPTASPSTLATLEAKPVFPTYSPTVSGGDATSSPSMPPTPRPTSAATTATPPPTPKPVGGDDDLYSGRMSTTFQYEIFNTENANAQSMVSGRDPENDMMAVILQSTSDFVDGVVDVTFGTVEAQTAGPFVDHGKGNKRNLYQTTLLAFGNGRRRLRIATRTLLVTLPPDSVAIDNVEEVPCSDTSLPTSNCQRVTASANLALVNEPKDDTELQFQTALNRGLEDPGIAYPSDSGIVYAGPASSSNVVDIPKATDPVGSEGEAPPEDNGGGTPAWVVPVSIGAAAVGSVLLAVFVGQRVQKRKRSAKEFDGLEGDLAGGEGRASYDAEMQIGAPVEVSPLDTPGVESGGKVSPPGSDNPFLDDSSSASSSSSSSSGSSSSSLPSGSYSQSVSSSSEDSAGVGGVPSSEEEKYWKERDEYWKNKEADAVVQLRENDPKSFWKAKEAEMKQKEEGTRALPPEEEVWERAMAKHAKGSPSSDGGRQDYNRLHDIEEASKESLAQSGWSLASHASDNSDKSVYRAGVEALVKEACPERLGELNEMMVEYQGREEVLIGQLSTLLAAKNRSEVSSSGASSSEYDSDQNDRLDASNRSYETGGSDTSGYMSSSASEFTSSTGAGASSSVAASLDVDSRRGSQGLSLKNSSSNSGEEVDGGGTAAPAPATMEVTVTSAAAATSLLSSTSPADDLRSSSSTGSSGWSSDDGFSSVDTSSLASSEVPNQIASAPLDKALADIGELSAVSQRVTTGYSGSEKPTFIPVDGPDDDTDTPDKSTEASQVATRKDLDDAINAGDWQAVGATAALIANLSPSNSQDKSDDFNESNVSITSHEKNQVTELEQLVEAGDWNAVMQAASRYDGVSDSEHNLMDSRQDVNDESSKEFTPEQAEGAPSRESLRAEIEELVRTVVPEELVNLDEMMLQFRDREEELITTLKTMTRERPASEGGKISSSSSESGAPLLPGSSHHRSDDDRSFRGSVDDNTVYTNTNASMESR